MSNPLKSNKGKKMKKKNLSKIDLTSRRYMEIVKITDDEREMVNKLYDDELERINQNVQQHMKEYENNLVNSLLSWLTEGKNTNQKVSDSLFKEYEYLLDNNNDNEIPNYLESLLSLKVKQ